MRAIWKGAISFGLVNIPIALYPATRAEELKFRLLRASDLSPVNYKRVAEADGKEVAWDQIVKGYEYEKGKFIVLKDEDFQRVDIEATQTVEISSFVELKEVNPIFFHKPYYMEPQKGGDKAYVLLREALASSGKIAIARVVIKTRQHLASVKPQEKGLMLELMHFADELVDIHEFRLPAASEVGKKELQMARALVDSMSDEWKPEDYVDQYRTALEKLIGEKVKHGDEKLPKTTARKEKATNVIDLVSVLQKSLDQSGGKKPRKPAPHKTRRKAA
ncbi:MAG TPA: Ku protein [Chthoniobacteraceae bacterium]|jgi:DNA end-binding protein Ku|nr:Ku protein [Chthoniobacteraceae bacterium]